MRRVKSGLEAGRVALWERHPAHPGGEVLIAGERVYAVGDTPAVREALRDGRLVEIKAETEAKAKKGKR